MERLSMEVSLHSSEGALCMEEGRILRRRAHSLSFICSSEEEDLSNQVEV